MEIEFKLLTGKGDAVGFPTPSSIDAIPQRGDFIALYEEMFVVKHITFSISGGEPAKTIVTIEKV
jgi:hypothetical protein